MSMKYLCTVKYVETKHGVNSTLTYYQYAQDVKQLQQFIENYKTDPSIISYTVKEYKDE